MQKFCITFAGCVGSSKTPISNYISTKLNLPIFNNDAIRSEVIENIGFLDIEKHRKIRNERLQEILESGISFIADISVDRERENFKEKLSEHGYIWFIISTDLSKDLLIRLYKAKGYDESLQRLDTIFQDHEKFLEKFSDDIGLQIGDEQFLNRLALSFNAVKQFIDNIVTK
ncbi:MAG TPA: hypothetical protein PK674_03220 [Candidatus Absconditabacterales bacterium]|nr:hypothetical protein [Candidatus Absconditabacterales bacterium]HOQ78641.1 hypothetical protein [Candidatus Absconditabacterales bacterium]HPK28061.1 hypothetical protein [Candidatus Absconditabacterales bacterium]